MHKLREIEPGTFDRIGFVLVLIQRLWEQVMIRLGRPELLSPFQQPGTSPHRRLVQRYDPGSGIGLGAGELDSDRFLDQGLATRFFSGSFRNTAKSNAPFRLRSPYSFPQKLRIIRGRCIDAGRVS